MIGLLNLVVIDGVNYSEKAEKMFNLYSFSSYSPSESILTFFYVIDQTVVLFQYCDFLFQIFHIQRNLNMGSRIIFHKVDM